MSPSTRARAALARGLRSTLTVAASALVGAAILTTGGTVGPAQASVLGPSTINICKNGPVTGTFQFSINGATPVSVTAGTCEPFTVENGHNTVTELPDATGATTLSAITVSPSIDTVSLSVPTRTVTVNIPANQAVTTTFTNIPVTKLQVCKVAGDPATTGKSFNFTESVSGTTTASFSLNAAAPGTSPNCSTPTAYPAGTAVNVAEGLVANNKVTNITVTNGTGSNVNLGAGTVTATLGTSGTTVVTYTDQTTPGNLVVCKLAANTFVSPGPWSFTITDSMGHAVAGSPVTVTVGNCSSPLSLPPGNYTVVETFSSPDTVSSITASPPSALVSVNLPAGSGVFTVTSGATTTATFTNKVPVANLIVCKQAGDAPTEGKSFPFTESVGGTTTQSFTLTAHQLPPLDCHGPTAYPAGTAVDLAETVPSGSKVTNITSSGPGTLSNVMIPAGTATATLGGDGTTMTVTYTDDLAGGGLVVCKFAANSSVSPGPWSFTITDSMGHAVVGSPVTVLVGNCSSPLSLPAGNYTVVETFSPPDTVSAITGSPTSSVVSVNLPTGTGVFTVTSGATTTANFTNSVPNGNLVVCKLAANSFVSPGPWSFTITDSMGHAVAGSPVTVTVGNCSSPLSLPPGNYTVVETFSPPDTVSAITGSPTTSVVSVNLPTGTGVFTVTSGATTTGTFTNKVPTSNLVVCKIAGDTGTIGKVFNFTQSVNGSTTATFPLTAATTPTVPPNCFTKTYPAGTVVNLAEASLTGFQLTNITNSGGTLGNVNLTGGTATATLPSGDGSTMTVYFTNVTIPPLGWVEVCKVAADSVTAGQTFTFTVNGGAPFTVMAGNCSAPIQVPAGTATVNEIQSNPAFYLANVSTVSVTDPSGSRLLTGPTTTPAIVVVPVGPVSNETTVTFTNAAKLGAFKICTTQTSPGANLAGQIFTYSYSYTVNGLTTTGTVSLIVPIWGATCSAVIGPIDPTNSNGTPVKVTVTANPPTAGSVDLAGFSYQGAGTLLSSPILPSPFPASASFTVGIGMNILTFTNGATH
jgi:hypothetical protein